MTDEPPALRDADGGDIDVIVVTYKTRDLTLRCLTHLAAQTAAHRTIVVDNAPGDGTGPAIRDAFPDVTVIESPDNGGFGHANNIGAASGSGTFIVLVNSDLFVEDDFLDELVRPLRERPAIGQVAGLTLLPGEGPDRIDSAGVSLDRTLAGVNHLRHRPAEDARASVGRDPIVPSGSAAAFRREAWEAVGGFDDRLFAYGEDVDLGLRVAARGWGCQLDNFL